MNNLLGTQDSYFGNLGLSYLVGEVGPSVGICCCQCCPSYIIPDALFATWVKTTDGSEEASINFPTSVPLYRVNPGQNPPTWRSACYSGNGIDPGPSPPDNTANLYYGWFAVQCFFDTETGNTAFVMTTDPNNPIDPADPGDADANTWVFSPTPLAFTTGGQCSPFTWTFGPCKMTAVPISTLGAYACDDSYPDGFPYSAVNAGSYALTITP